MINRATINDLQRLCKVNSPQVMLIFVKNHLAEINRDGEHAEKIGKSWLFDEIAVHRIIELRGDAIPARAERETKEQADYLIGLGVDFIQGYYYARPMDEAHLEELFRSQLKPVG